ncbi:hypothetical protein IMZ48_16110 [Candidatus Bathyarchaeota archaeon]|nr:hypothetical protein [Candidatus Bathyarchaeota archaeon]
MELSAASSLTTIAEDTPAAAPPDGGLAAWMSGKSTHLSRRCSTQRI